MQVTYAELSVVMQWMDSGNNTPARALLVKVLRVAARDPMCPIQADWPILRMARYDSIDKLRRSGLMLLWCLVCAAVVRAQCVELEAPAIGRAAFNRMEAKIEAMSERQRGILCLVCYLYESGESMGKILQLLRWLHAGETGMPS